MKKGIVKLFRDLNRLIVGALLGLMLATLGMGVASADNPDGSQARVFYLPNVVNVMQRNRIAAKRLFQKSREWWPWMHLVDTIDRANSIRIFRKWANDSEICRSHRCGTIGNFCGAVDGFDEGQAAAALEAVAGRGTMLLDGLEKIFKDGLVAAEIADGGGGGAQIFVKGSGFDGGGF